MSKKATQYDVDTAQDIAEKAMQAAVFSLKRAKVLKVGAKKIKDDYVKGNKASKRKRVEIPFTVVKNDKR